VGLLATHGGNIVASPHTKLMCSPCLEDVGVWDLRTGQQVTCLQLCGGASLAVVFPRTSAARVKHVRISCTI
jgi:hypothetical protein